jgi:hypothetical protein
LAEWNGFEFLTVDYGNFSQLQNFGVVVTPPAILVSPQNAVLSVGQPATFSVTATGTTPLAYQWRKDGVAISGATSATLSLNGVQTDNAGSYSVVVSNAAGAVTSNAAFLTVTVPNPARLINLSILTALANGETMTLGTALGGAGTSGTKALLVRAAGPSLAQLGVAGSLPDPALSVFSGQTVVASNNDWGGSATLATAFANVGAFPYAAVTSKDAAVFNPAFVAGNYTVQVTGGGGSGLVIAELYDSTPANTFTPTTPRLVNVSVLKQINAGQTLTAGFVVGGAGTKQVLVRAVGPGLAQLGVGGVMADPQLTLNQTGVTTPIATNNDWGGGATLATAFTNVGAFALPTSSKDAALLVALSPGNYTAQVGGVGGSAGLALVEVYEVP